MYICICVYLYANVHLAFCTAVHHFVDSIAVWQCAAALCRVHCVHAIH